jgi:hypothetical protein
MRTSPDPASTTGLSAGALLQLVRSGAATTRAELAVLSGLARSTVSQRVDALIEANLIYEAGDAPSTGGRPPVRLAFNENTGVVLTADLGATHARLAVMDFGASPIAEEAVDLDIADGPDTVLGRVAELFDQMLTASGRSSASNFRAPSNTANSSACMRSSSAFSRARCAGSRGTSAGRSFGSSNMIGCVLKWPPLALQRECRGGNHTEIKLVEPTPKYTTVNRERQILTKPFLRFTPFYQLIPTALRIHLRPLKNR